jgi:short-subunit dehydrogenase
MVKFQLKPVSRQTIVITGATGGIGQATARRAAQRGANVVLAARNADLLRDIGEELTAQGWHVMSYPLDVADVDAVRALAQETIARFGGFDTWVNNAGVSIFGRQEQVALADQRRLFDTNFWGTVHGSLIAVDHLKQHGGALINVGGDASDFAVPLQGMYSASKHAVKAFTDSLRLELEEEGAPISVTLVKPATTDSGLVRHAKNYMDVEPRLSPPVYPSGLVADAILFAAENLRRDIYVGGAGRLMLTGSHYAPRLVDRYMEHFMFGQQRSERPATARRPNALYHAVADEPDTQLDGAAYLPRKHGVLTARTAAVIALGAGLVAGAFVGARRSARRRRLGRRRDIARRRGIV